MSLLLQMLFFFFFPEIYTTTKNKYKSSYVRKQPYQLEKQGKLCYT